MEKTQAVVIGEKIFSNSKQAYELYEKKRFGEKKGEKVIYMPEEAFFLYEKKQLDFLSNKYKEMKSSEILKKLIKINKRFLVCYAVFSDLRNKGLIVKSGLKFGGDFRVYKKGVKIKEGHSEWICYCLDENKSLNLKDFSSKNRVSHSTKKKLLLSIVDSENDVSYYETCWKRIV